MMKVGIPRGLFYYYDFNRWKYFFKKLNIDYIVSPETDLQIINLGRMYSNDEMCLSLKIYLGHVAYLADKCDYLLIPRVDNFGINDQTCTNFIAVYDIVRNLFNTKILNYNIDYVNGDTFSRAFLSMGVALGFKKRDVRDAIRYSDIMYNKYEKKNNIINTNKLYGMGKKILIVGHDYNISDKYVGYPVVKKLEELGCVVINSNYFDRVSANMLSKNFSYSLYWKYNKEIIGSISMAHDYIDGVLFLSSFPCGPDSIVNELVSRKLDLPHINLVVDELDSMAGMETRLESFVDILG